MTNADMIVVFAIYLTSITYLLKRVWDYESIQDIVLALIIGSIFVIGCITNSITLIILADLIGLSKILHDLSIDSEFN